jgi:hypothetical protein
MKRATISAAAVAAVLVGLLAGSRGVIEHNVDASAASRAAASSTASTEEARQGFLYGRVTTYDGGTYAGRLRFGRDEEAFWGDYFNGFKPENTWATRSGVPELMPATRTFVILGFEIPLGERRTDLGRPFMARFGDIARVDAPGRNVRVTLKSGTVFNVDWGGANDLDDGVRVWDESRGVVDLAGWNGPLPPPARVRIRTIEFLPARHAGAAPGRLHGTVRTAHGDFTGFVQWDRQACVATDELTGRAAEGPLRVRFDTIRAIARHSRDSALVTLQDGREIVLSGTRAVGDRFRGIYVDDARYGRVLVSWDAFERIQFSAAGSGPAYDEFPQGRALTGTVTTRGGRRLTGRLVYDLDESETTETLDAPYMGVDYTIPFGLIASIGPGTSERATVMLHGGGKLSLDRAGDLGERNAGMLIFVEGRERAEYVRWSDVEQIHFDRPPVMYPPLRTR